MSRQSIEAGGFRYEPKQHIEPDVVPVDETAFYIQQKKAEIIGASTYQHYIDAYTNPFDGITPVSQNGGTNHQDQKAERAAAQMARSIQTQFGVEDYQDPYLASNSGYTLVEDLSHR